MRFLVTGVNGQLGYDIVKELKSRGYTDIVALSKDELDITKKKRVESCILVSQPDVIFHCAAYTAVDKAEDDKLNAKKVNTYATKYIADASVKSNSKIVYISTDYVFDGNKPLDQTYDVDDPVNPKSVYGKTKYDGEVACKVNPKHFIVRTSWVFGINGKNFVKTMINLSKDRNEINVVCDQHGSPTYTVDLAKALVDMSLTDKYGVYHVNNEGYTTWADFAEEIFKVNNIDIKVNRIDSDKFQSRAQRPKNSCLSKKCLDENGFERLPDWQDALRRYSRELEKYNENSKKLNLYR